MNGLLKCYYGYKNRGDELLFFGVVDYLSTHFDIDELFVEVGDKKRMDKRLQRNSMFVNSATTVTLVTSQERKEYEKKQNNNQQRQKSTKIVKFFGGGEIFNDDISYQRAEIKSRKGLIYYLAALLFARTGRNYYITYWKDISRGLFVLLGGIGKPRKLTTQLLYSVMLPKAQSIIAREKVTAMRARKYSHHVIHYQDFAIPVIEQRQGDKTGDSSPVDGKYLLINIHPRISGTATYERITTFAARYPDHQYIYVPCGHEDESYYAILTQQPGLGGMQLYDRKEYTIAETLSLFAHAAAGIGARLHFLLPLQQLGIDYEAIVYSEKVQKMMDEFAHNNLDDD